MEHTSRGRGFRQSNRFILLPDISCDRSDRSTLDVGDPWMSLPTPLRFAEAAAVAVSGWWEEAEEEEDAEAGAKEEGRVTEKEGEEGSDRFVEKA